MNNNMTTTNFNPREDSVLIDSSPAFKGLDEIEGFEQTSALLGSGYSQLPIDEEGNIPSRLPYAQQAKNAFSAAGRGIKSANDFVSDPDKTLEAGLKARNALLTAGLVVSRDLNTVGKVSTFLAPTEAPVDEEGEPVLDKYGEPVGLTAMQKAGNALKAIASKEEMIASTLSRKTFQIFNAAADIFGGNALRTVGVGVAAIVRVVAYIVLAAIDLAAAGVALGLSIPAIIGYGLFVLTGPGAIFHDRHFGEGKIMKKEIKYLGEQNVEQFQLLQKIGQHLGVGQLNDELNDDNLSQASSVEYPPVLSLLDDTFRPTDNASQTSTVYKNDDKVEQNNDKASQVSVDQNPDLMDLNSIDLNPTGFNPNFKPIDDNPFG